MTCPTPFPLVDAHPNLLSLMQCYLVYSTMANGGMASDLNASHRHLIESFVVQYVFISQPELPSGCYILNTQSARKLFINLNYLINHLIIVEAFLFPKCT